MEAPSSSFRQIFNNITQGANSRLFQGIADTVTFGKEEKSPEERKLQKLAKVRKWLQPPDIHDNLDKALNTRQKGTAEWIFSEHKYISWRTRPASTLWVRGKSGSGKTVLSSSIVKSLQASSSEDVGFFFFDFNDAGKQSIKAMLASLICQFYAKYLTRLEPNTPDALDKLRNACAEGSRARPSQDDLLNLLKMIIESLSAVYLIFDALDEASRDETKNLLKVIKEICTWDLQQLHVLVTTQEAGEVGKSLNNLVTNTDTIDMRPSCIDRDIRIYVRETFEIDMFNRWGVSRESALEIEDYLISNAEGM